MRILFIGCVESSKILLKELLEKKYNVVGVITCKKNNINSDYVDLLPICKKNNLPLNYSESGNDQETVEFSKRLYPDIIYCFGWSRLLKKNILETASLGGIGFHPTNLPMNRGRHPIIWTLVLGLPKTAVSFFLMDLTADTGKVIYQSEVVVDYTDTARTLYDAIMNKAKIGIVEITEKLINGENFDNIVLDDKTGNEWRKRSQKDGIIDWRMSSRAIYNLVRGLSKPYIGAEFIKDNQRIKVWKVEEIIVNNIENIEYGKVLKVISDKNYYIKAYDNVIHVLESDSVNLKEGEYL